MKKYIIALFLCISVAFTFTSCTKKENSNDSGNKNTQEQKSDSNTSTESKDNTQKKDDQKNSGEDTSLIQFEEPKPGDEIAVFETSMGKIKFKLFPKEAPKTVENLKKLIQKKYYDGITFHRVINNFMIQGGDPTATGTGGESAFGSAFEDEFTSKLHNFRGALSMANAGANTNGSQFFIVQAKEVAPDLIKAMENTGKESYSTSVINKYKEVGGTPHLDYKHTVFGQVIEGMDVVDKIATTKVGENDKPVTDVKINKAYLEKYSK